MASLVSRPVNARLFWKALVVQAILVGGLFAILVALPLPEHFFKDFGFLTGPLAWIVCSIGTGRILKLPLGFVAFAALAGGVAGLIVLIAASHYAGMVAALLVFSASCGSYEPEPDEVGSTAAAD
jgi:hypothetical protein